MSCTSAKIYASVEGFRGVLPGFKLQTTSTISRILTPDFWSPWSNLPSPWKWQTTAAGGFIKSPPSIPPLKMANNRRRRLFIKSPQSISSPNLAKIKKHLYFSIPRHWSKRWPNLGVEPPNNIFSFFGCKGSNPYSGKFWIVRKKYFFIFVFN